MAIMYPSNIESYNYTESEKFFYNKLKYNLSDDFKVFYSIRWYKNINNKKEHSECDFLIFHPNHGYLTIEVKGGVEITVENGQWKIRDYECRQNYRILKRSPFIQAQESMYYFKNYYEEQFASVYRGTYGFAVAFPFYKLQEDLNIGEPKFLVIDSEDFENLEDRIINIFNYWRGKRSNYLPFSYEQQKKFVSLLNKRISLSAAAGVLINIRERELEKINRIQENFIQFIKNYKRAFIIGGAGTGKSWIGIKKAINDYNQGKSVLVIVPSEILNKFFKATLNHDNISCITIEKIKEVNNKYDSIIVDEAQDISEKIGRDIVNLLQDKDKSELLVMYDDNQRIYDVSFRDSFGIKYPPFILTQNIRNTAAIYNWCVRKTGIGIDVSPNIIEGIEPEVAIFYEERPAVRKLEDILNTLINKECVDCTSITVLSNVKFEESILKNYDELGKYKFDINNITNNTNHILFARDIEFKGLESDVIIYLKHNSESNKNNKIEYIAYTRARFYLYVIEIKRR